MLRVHGHRHRQESESVNGWALGLHGPHKGAHRGNGKEGASSRGSDGGNVMYLSDREDASATFSSPSNF